MAYLYDEGTNTTDTVYLLGCSNDDGGTVTVQLANNSSGSYPLTADHHLNLALSSSNAMLTLEFYYGESWERNNSGDTATVALGSEPSKSVGDNCTFTDLPIESKLHITVTTTGGVVKTTIFDPKICVIPPHRSGGGHDL